MFNISLRSNWYVHWSKCLEACYYYIILFSKKVLVVLPSNYRLTSLTCCGCQVLEKIICKKLLQYRYFRMVLPLVSCSVLSYLLYRYLNEVMCSFDKKIDVDIIYSDIAKAFDSVSHVKLPILSVLQSYGIAVMCLTG